MAEKEVPDLNQWLHGVEAEAIQRGYPNLFIAASDPKHPLGGGSVLRTGDTPDSEVFHKLRAQLVAWEKERGMDPTHDWRKGYEEMKANGNSYGMSDYRDEQKKLVQKAAFMEGYMAKESGSVEDQIAEINKDPIANRYLYPGAQPEWWQVTPKYWGEDALDPDKRKRLVRRNRLGFPALGFGRRSEWTRHLPSNTLKSPLRQALEKSKLTKMPVGFWDKHKAKLGIK